MKAKIVFLIMLSSMMLVACSGDKQSEESSSGKNESVNIKELVHDYSTGSIKGETASITSKQLNVTDEDNKETLYDLPDDEFFVSIAPYINETHP
ncbi:hypothetical protein FA727_14980 [Robertmurraya kyonggiensis]|uniref:Uncharacterized protein n=2 Tax=Robertmurraya kyonggiensis TaxID=1037680 RepID=A0A4U1D1R9_9BACI|nr:hypothetical protein FA727_14980 [Robertmurraya kyonggiensis]